MGAHLKDGKFQSDKYPSCPAGKVPLSTRDTTAQDLLWEYAQRRARVDVEFCNDLETALKLDGFVPTDTPDNAIADDAYAWCKGKGPEPYAPQVASLVVLIRKHVEAERMRGTDLIARAKEAHAEVGRHASFLLKLYACETPGDVCEKLAQVIVMHNGFPTVDGSKL
jgi:hypothetical protein